MTDYRPFHAPGCPARDPAVNVDRLRIDEERGDWPASIVTERVCTCPPERFGPGAKPAWEPGDEPRPLTPLREEP